MSPSLKAALAFVAVLALLAPEISSPAESGKADGTASGELPPAPPLGLSGLPVPNGNPISRAKVDLGRILFFEKRLSGDGTIACASCHMPGRDFSNGRKYGIGVGGRLGLRHVPTLVNAAYNKFQFWDGRAGSLEEQAKSPMLNPAEMAATEDHIVRTLSAIPGYRSAFGETFGTEEITLERVARAIANFERTILSGRSPFDRRKYGSEESAISEEVKRGFEIFRVSANYEKCHLINESSAPFINNKFHNAVIGGVSKPPR
jgi:cytochrome c peroxidase